MQKFLLLCIALVSSSIFGFGQILDDSTQQVYGPTSTQSFTFDDILLNTKKRSFVDTSLLNLHNYNFYFKNNILYQDLGNFGTPLNRIYYEAPESLGKKLGLSTLYEYGYSMDRTLYYDTKSPYTKLFYIQGTKGQQSMEVEHTQNIRKNWNVGFSLKRIISLKQLATGSTKEKQMSHYSFDLHSSYFSKNKRYTMLLDFQHLDHAQFENGGIFVDTNETKENMFDYKLEKVQLYSLPNSINSKTHLRSYTKNTQLRLYNQYGFDSSQSIQLFHQFDYQSNIARYDDDYLRDTAYSTYNNYTYYPNTNYDSMSTHDKILNEVYENKVGLKGTIQKIFYMGYFKRRDFTYLQTNHEIVDRKYSENYFGGNLRYSITDSSHLTGKAEFMLFRDYLVSTSFTNNFLHLSYSQLSYSPTLFQLKNISNSYQWENYFSNTSTSTFSGMLTLRIKKFIFAPTGSYSSIQDYIYFDEKGSPRQSGLSVQQASVGFYTKLNWKFLFLENHLRYTKIAGADVLRVPEVFNQAKVYVYGTLFRKALRLQLGVDISWKSSYYGNSYAPGVQQFTLSYTSNPINYLDSYLLTDVYLNTQIKRGFIFLKLSHANQGLSKPGYFITPYYTALPRSFEFGVRWLFYD